MPNATKFLHRLLRYIWGAPCSVVGLVLAAPLLLAGAKAHSVCGVLEIALSQQEKLGFSLLNRLPFCAITFGHVVIGLTEHNLEHLRAHEHEHVRQYERWGLFFFLAYPASSLYQWVCGNNPYWDNRFEVQARLSAANAKNEA
ncbi:hypothetical protein ACFDAU_07250 [Sulfuriferula sp. GW1]|uniref:hypothetical protein n=1 Tax=Sulfuriferula sp. GW1 TaxID=3345111 RepID=UPI0039AFFD0D